MSGEYPDGYDQIVDDQESMILPRVNGNGHHRAEDEQNEPPANVELQEESQAPAKKRGRPVTRVDFSQLLDPEDRADGPLMLGSLADLQLRHTEWDWQGWLARGYLTVLAAESGMGKSYLALRIAACYLLGWPWPDGTPFRGETGLVLWCEAEGALQLTLERAAAWGLPPDKIITPIPADKDFTLTNRRHVDALAGALTFPGIKLVVIDSLSGAYPEIEKGTDYAVPVMKWIAAQLRDSNRPGLATHHLRKRGILDSEEVTLDRLRGASAIQQTARLVWAMDAPAPDAPDNKRLSVIKSNLGKFPGKIGALIANDNIDFGAAPEAPKIETVADKAIDLLRALLENGPIPYDEVEQARKAAGISESTVNRVKAKLRIESRKIDGVPCWALPVARGVGYDY